jgi:hypothetical protein
MGRLGTALGSVSWPDQARRLARPLNPVVASPAAPLGQPNSTTSTWLNPGPSIWRP